MSLHRKIESDQFPKKETQRRQSTARTSLKLVPNYEANAKLPQLADTSKASKEALFCQKLKLCSETFNFLENKELKEKKLKFSTLKELLEFITEEGNVSTLKEPTYRQIVNMVAENIFRTFPPAESAEYEPEYDQQIQEAAWPHMKLVYDILLQLLNSAEINVALLKKAINRSFITKLLELFDSEDERERKCLQNLLLSIYLKLFEQRSFIRRHIRNIFLRYVYEVEQFNGISDLLEIMAMTINGFNVPLRQEHKDFLNKVLLPLHTPKNLAVYQKSLIDCLKGFMKKDEKVTEEIFTGLLKFWPKTCADKEVLFLQEAIEILELTTNDQFVKFQEKLAKQIAKSASSLHFQVAETTLNLWDNMDFSRHFNNNVKILMPIILPSVYRVSKTHWNSSIAELASSLLQRFSQSDPTLFNSVIATCKSKGRKQKRK